MLGRQLMSPLQLAAVVVASLDAFWTAAATAGGEAARDGGESAMQPLPQQCSVAVVGGGPGGVYFAWRLALAGTKDICIFERAGRVGGRIYTLRNMGEKQDLTVEAGAYRFAEQPMYEDGKWYLHMPLNAAIVRELGIKTGRYAPHEANNTLLKLVSEDGHNAGFTLFVEKMLQQAEEHGTRIFYHRELSSLSRVEGGTKLNLHLNDGGVVLADKVLLNLPQMPLLKVLGNSDLDVKATDVCKSLHAVQVYNGVKLYVYYETAWWRTKLNLTVGDFSTTDDPSQQTPPLSGRYHDGDFRCNQTSCYGYLEASYAWDAFADWYSSFVLSHDPPVMNLGSPNGEALLEDIHSALLEYHAAQLAKVNATQEVAAMRPLAKHSVLSYWSRASTGFGAGAHWTMSGKRSPARVVTETMHPISSLPLYVANEAFGALREADGSVSGSHSWAECSLTQAENVLSRFFKLPRPSWIEEDLYNKKVLYPSLIEGTDPATSTTQWI
eukprot:TRINITY_DN56733_c0_g1_i1.p1 TRINITY_DN56733_c0_g1~~TRINITY_DN56733_c0_g1_i1.p1  ORF type:complete len:496 (-),score=96.04 TRINITY_DN56733_c0_g1_i1:137-1624(-)